MSKLKMMKQLKSVISILLCVTILLVCALPSFAENDDFQKLGGESATAEVADGEYSADGESAQSTESDFTGEDAAQTASESGSDENSGDVEAAESAESEDDDNSSGSDEESASEDSAGNAESITFFALEANESGEAAEGNEEENQTEVEETVYAESITLSETSAELLVGSELELEAVITPDDATAEVIWLSGNEDVASVVSGKVTALSAGTATITATVDELEAVCEVTVYEEMDVAFVWTDEITTIVSVRKGTTAEALSIADMPDGEALDKYRTGEYDVAWYMDDDYTEKFDFTTEITEPVTLYAKFLETLTVEYVWSDSQTTVSAIIADSCADSLELGDAPENIQALYDVRYQVIWYSDELLTEMYDFESAVTEDLTLYADYDFLPEMEWFADTTKSSYTLVTAAELQSLAALTAAGYTFAGVTIYLGEDETESNTDTGTLDLSGIEWEPIGTAEHPFAGTFDGGIYGAVDGEIGLTGTFTLSGLSLGSYKEFDYAGLFGYATGDIRNVTVSGTVYVTAQYAGGIVGWLEGTIINCTNQTNVYNYEADGIIGGIAGYVNGAVYSCINEGTRVYNRTDGNGIVGGIVGTICGYVTDSDNSGRYVTGKGYAAGGIAGALKSTSQVLRCTSSAQVGNTADSAAGGGIVGEMEESTTVQYCGNTGAITSTAAAGGIVGRLTGTGTVASCFNSGDVTYEKSSRGGGILGYSENGYENVISQCCNLSTQDGTFLDADYVTATTDAGEAAYIMDNGGSEERYDVWGWINGDAVPTLISMGSSQVYSLTLTAPKSIVTPLPQNYYPVGETIVIYAAKDLENGDEWIVSGFADYTVSEDLFSISFVMPAEDIAISVTVANQSKEYTAIFYGYIDSDNEYTTYDTQSVYGGECVVAPEEQEGAADINAYYPYYEDEVFRGYYVFMGWYLMDDDGALSEEYDFDWMVGTDLELYAEWSLVTVQFSFNGVKTTTSLPSSYKTGIKVSLPQPTPEPETSLTDSSFLGWSTEKSLTAAEMNTESENTKLWKFDDDDEAWVLDIDNTENMTLQFYAIWSDTVTAWATANGVEGNGSQDKPFTITTDEQLNTLSGVLTEEQDLSGYYFELSNDGDNGGTFTLTNPIVGYHSYDYSSSADDYVFTISEFNGSFDGNDCTVDLSEAGFSLFGILGEDAVVSNLNLTGDIDTSDYTEDDDYYIVVSRTDEDTGNNLYNKATGSVASVNYGQIVSCNFEGTVTDKSSNALVGGIVGASLYGGSVEDCSVSDSEVIGGDIDATASQGIAGGIVGAMYGSGTISNCTVTGSNVTGSRVAGGILGATDDVSEVYLTSLDILFEILNCKVETDSSGDKGSVSTTLKYGAGVSGTTGNTPAIGGIAGIVNNTNIEDCENSSAIKGQYLCGGIIGCLKGGSISSCKNKGVINVEYYNPQCVGGIVGEAVFVETITASDNSGAINVSHEQNDDTKGYPACIGGIVGYCVFSNSIYSTDSFTSNITQCHNNGDITVNSVLSAATIGGLIGQISRSSTGYIMNITGCTQSGAVNVSAEGESAGFAKYIGLIVGQGKNHYIIEDLTVSNSSLNVSAPSCSYVGIIPSSPLSYSGITLKNIEINVTATSADAEYIGGVFASLSLTDAEELEAVSWDEIKLNIAAAGTVRYVGGLAASLTAGTATEDEGGESNASIDIEDISLNNISVAVEGNAEYVGGISGLLSCSEGTLSGEFSDIEITVAGDGSYVGGIAGQISGDVILSVECEDFAVQVDGEANCTGGIVGNLADASVSKDSPAMLSYCSFDGDVEIGSTGEDVGGLVGYGSVEYSFLDGDFQCDASNDYSVGLLAGEGAVISSFFYGDGSSVGSVSGTTDSVECSYYLGSSSDAESQSKSADEFKSGYVAWLMEIGGDEEDIGDHAFVWKQGSKHPEWSDGDATVYRVGVADDLEHVEISLSDSKECVYLNDDDEGVEVTVTVSEDTYSVTEGEEEVEYGYVLQSFSHISEPDEATTTLKTYSTEENITVLTYNYTPTSDGRMSAAVATVLLDAKEITPPAAEEDGEGDGDGSGDDDSEGSGGSGGGDGTGYGGTDETTASTSVPTIGAEEEGPTVISDTSPDVQIEETLGEEAPSGGTEAEETVESSETETEAESEIEPEPEPELEPELEPEVESEKHIYELVANIVETIKDNPLLAALVGVLALAVLVGGGAYQYRKYKKNYADDSSR